MHFLVPHSLESQLAAFLAKLEDSSADLGVSDVQMSLTSLEEVFLAIAKKARPRPHSPARTRHTWYQHAARLLKPNQHTERLQSSRLLPLQRLYPHATTLSQPADP